MKEKISEIVFKIVLWSPLVISIFILVYLLFYEDIMNWF